MPVFRQLLQLLVFVSSETEPILQALDVLGVLDGKSHNRAEELPARFRVYFSFLGTAETCVRDFVTGRRNRHEHSDMIPE